jgi:hypothetical protein
MSPLDYKTNDKGKLPRLEGGGGGFELVDFMEKSKSSKVDLKGNKRVRSDSWGGGGVHLSDEVAGRFSKKFDAEKRYLGIGIENSTRYVSGKPWVFDKTSDV